MKRLSMILTLALFAPACDAPEELNGIAKPEGLAGELQVCIAGPEDDMKACIRDVLTPESENTLAPRLEGPDLLSNGEPDPVNGWADDPFGLEDDPISCSSKDGKMDCFFTSGGCCRNQTKCWGC